MSKVQNEVLQKLYVVNKLLVLVGRVAEELEELFGKPVSWGIFILLLVSILAMVFYTRPLNAASSGIVYIRADGSINPSTAPISSIDNITYLFTGNISYPTYNGIVIQRNDISIDGNDFTMKGFNQTGMGLNLTNISNVTIKNSNIENFLVGIYLSGSNNSLVDNNIMNNTNGIHLYSSSYNTVTKNNITMNSVSGILLEYSYNNNVISQNMFLDDGLTVWASRANSIVDNLVNVKPLIYIEGISNYTVNGDAGQVVLVDCNQTHVENLTISGTTFGIDLWNTVNSSISGCTIANSVYGITLDESSLNTISGNSITTNHYHGIFLDSSTNNTIVGNDLAANGQDGIVLMDGSSFNVVSGNNITESGDYGVSLSSANNWIYRNNFVNNTHQACSILIGSTNIWDIGYEGNYWSDYNGTDANHDGIGDTPYVIDANNTDNYPLMVQYAIPEFPSSLILTLFMIATLLPVIVYKKKDMKTS